MTPDKFFNNYKIFQIFIIYYYFYWHFCIFKLKFLLFKITNNNKKFLIINFIITFSKMEIFRKKCNKI